mmetsp:Transcript_48699/g.76031  ORF Transcript_48699/g.76031 Transcript_48699/m.76031 type:complete len:155 (+) Transcript_48699:1-465(+)
MAVCRSAGVPLIINDRVDIAIACDADGVHVGQDDLPCTVVRRMIGPGKIVGVSTHNVEEALQALEDGADYIGTGAIYPTSTKDSTAIGVNALKTVCDACGIPCVAIGGINAQNASEVMKVGAAGIAVVSAIFNKPQPDIAAAELGEVVRRAAVK